MNRLVVACLARNEAHRFWRSALRAWKSFADEIVVLDDNSTDDTSKIAEEEGALVCPGNVRASAWGHEAYHRSALWEISLDVAEPGDYLFILDADMTPARNPHALLEAEPDAVAFNLYDLWGANPRCPDEDCPWLRCGKWGLTCPKHSDTNQLLYRDDLFWRAHLHPRVWLVRVPEEPSEGWRWHDRGIHCGHLPSNLDPKRVLIAPRDYSLLHYGYFTPEIRAEKYARYASVSDQLSDFERRHAQSILDPNPHLIPLPFDPELRLELASP